MKLVLILEEISKANKKDSETILRAAVRRREEHLDGEEVLCAEFTRQQVERRNAIMERMRKYEEEFMSQNDTGVDQTG